MTPPSNRHRSAGRHCYLWTYQLLRYKNTLYHLVNNYFPKLSSTSFKPLWALLQHFVTPSPPPSLHPHDPNYKNRDFAPATQQPALTCQYLQFVTVGYFKHSHLLDSNSSRARTLFYSFPQPSTSNSITHLVSTRYTHLNASTNEQEKLVVMKLAVNEWGWAAGHCWDSKLHFSFRCRSQEQR